MWAADQNVSYSLKNSELILRIWNYSNWFCDFNWFIENIQLSVPKRTGVDGSQDFQWLISYL